jgi:hypothetical protein
MAPPRVTKPSAASRTVDMFAAPKPIEERPVEVIENDAHEGERLPLEQDVDRFRDSAFKVQEWTTKAFGQPDAPGNEYRVSRKGLHYLVETLAKTPGSATAYGYVGVMVHERDLYAFVSVLVQAVREKQKREAADAAVK